MTAATLHRSTTPHTAMTAMSPAYVAEADRQRQERARIADAAKVETIARRELDSDRWNRNARLDLRCILMAALAVQDRLEGADDELDTLLSDWANHLDYRTFPAAERGVALAGDGRDGMTAPTLTTWPPAEEQHLDDALLALFKMRDRLVQRNANHEACRLDEIMERLEDFARRRG